MREKYTNINDLNINRGKLELVTTNSRIMNWLDLMVKGIFSGTVVVIASEIAKKSAVFGALITSIPLISVLSLTWLYEDTKDTAQVADFAESILWLVLPSTLLFILLPYLLRQGWSFENSMIAGITATILAYGVGVFLASNYITSN
tara:strand:+ start:2769 stop:3206 length:438 start_codon:yes stop_codon:yes gene_type:complete